MCGLCDILFIRIRNFVIGMVQNMCQSNKFLIPNSQL